MFTGFCFSSLSPRFLRLLTFSIVLPAIANLIPQPAYAQIVPRNYLARPEMSERPASRLSRFVFQLEVENGGMLYKNGQVREELGEVYYNGVNLKIGWQTERGSDVYHQLYNYPIYGIGLYSSTFRKAAIGTPNALYGFVAIPIKPGRLSRWDFNYRISLGLASNFEPYNEENNPFNTLLGTHRNVFIDLGLQANYRLSERLQIGVGTAFHHFSNGAIRKPNTGINLLPLTVAVTYRPVSRTFDFGIDSVPPVESTNLFDIYYAMGIKQLEQGDRQYIKSTLGIFWSRPLAYKWRLGFGANLFYSESGQDPQKAGKRAGNLSGIVSGGPAFNIDHLLTSQLYLNGNIGCYLHRNRFNGETDPVFLRMGVRYRVIEQAYLGVSIKAHKGVADYVEWTLGYTLRRPYR